MSCNQRKVFTQIESIFVMLVVGILSVVLMPIRKLNSISTPGGSRIYSL